MKFTNKKKRIEIMSNVILEFTRVGVMCRGSEKRQYGNYEG